MNDYGPVSIDSLLISKPDLPLQTIGGGCLCCAAEADIGEAIVGVLAKGPIRLLVVETSGLADPTATLERLVDPDLADRIRLHGVATVVDAEATARRILDRRDARLWRAQIRLADWILLSKCDLLPPEGVARIEAELAQLNPQATVCRLPQNPPDPQTLLDAGIQQLKVPSKGRRPRTVQHAHQSHQTIGFQFTRAAHRGALERFLTRHDPEEVVRAKGFVRLRGHPRQWFVFHYVLGSHSIEPYSGHETPRPVGIFIGPGLDANAYQRRMQRVFDPDSSKSSRPSRPTRRSPARRRGR
jgi:G3E family GTPase